jgi:3-hydroxybutyryl-CoA dehydrogenase
VEETLTIVGSGAIACGVAAVAARGGEHKLWARSDSSATRATDRIHRLCSKLEVDPSHMSVVAGESVSGSGALEGATFVVEAIVEEHDQKAAVLAEIAGATGPDTIVATTTSSLSVEALAEASGAPERFVGLHVFNPVPQMKLVELAFSTKTSPEVRKRAHALCEALGKTAVEVADTPGFVVNRLLFPYLFDAVRLLEETGALPADIDTCMKLGAGHPMGPLALLDLVGLDVSKAIGETIGTEIPAKVDELIAEGALGRKSGRGFHSYD